MDDPSRIDDIAQLERRCRMLDDAHQTLTRELTAFKERYEREVSNLVAQLSLMRTQLHNRLVALTDRVVALESAVWEPCPTPDAQDELIRNNQRRRRRL
jgi:hypothetical protein